MGYTGGTKANPTYRDLGDHSEAIQIDFDPEVISYRELLEVFWTSHNPCGRRGSRQYMSAVFVGDDGERQLAEETARAAEVDFGKKVSTLILPLETFYLAEDYHQKYRLRHVKEIEAEYEAHYPELRDFVDSPAATRVNGFLGGYGSKDDLERIAGELGLSDDALALLAARVR